MPMTMCCFVNSFRTKLIPIHGQMSFGCKAKHMLTFKATQKIKKTKTKQKHVISNYKGHEVHISRVFHRKLYRISKFSLRQRR